jgi:hypothetical protein
VIQHGCGVEHLAQVASSAAGLGIQLVTVWQDRAQITARYGQHAATVVNDHRAKLVLSGITDSTTTGDLAQVIGDTEVVRHSTTTDVEGRTSATRATQPRCSPAPQPSASFAPSKATPPLRPPPTHRAPAPQPQSTPAPTASQRNQASEMPGPTGRPVMTSTAGQTGPPTSSAKPGVLMR